MRLSRRVWLRECGRFGIELTLCADHEKSPAIDEALEHSSPYLVGNESSLQRKTEHLLNRSHYIQRQVDRCVSLADGLVALLPKNIINPPKVPFSTTLECKRHCCRAALGYHLSNEDAITKLLLADQVNLVATIWRASVVDTES